MNKNTLEKPLSGSVILAIMELNKKLHDIAVKIIKEVTPSEEIPDDLMKDIKKIIKTGIKDITSTDPIDSVKVLLKILELVSENENIKK